jgi:hypothetical protein
VYEPRFDVRGSAPISESTHILNEYLLEEETLQILHKLQGNILYIEDCDLGMIDESNDKIKTDVVQHLLNNVFVEAEKNKFKAVCLSTREKDASHWDSAETELLKRKVSLFKVAQAPSQEYETNVRIYLLMEGNTLN